MIIAFVRMPNKNEKNIQFNLSLMGLTPNAAFSSGFTVFNS